jgi:hypothetical protein
MEAAPFLKMKPVILNILIYHDLPANAKRRTCADRGGRRRGMGRLAADMQILPLSGMMGMIQNLQGKWRSEKWT